MRPGSVELRSACFLGSGAKWPWIARIGGLTVLKSDARTRDPRPNRRLHGRAVERGDRAIDLVLGAHRLQHRDGQVRQPGKFGHGQGLELGIGGVQHGLFKSGRQPRQLALDRLPARACGFLQRHARHLEVAQAVLDPCALGLRQAVGTAGLTLDASTAGSTCAGVMTGKSGRPWSARSGLWAGVFMARKVGLRSPLHRPRM